MNVSLTVKLEEFVEQKVKTGRYQSASEVIRAGLRLLEEREQERRHNFAPANHEQLEEKLVEGLDSGSAGTMTDADWKKLRQRVQDHFQKADR